MKEFKKCARCGKTIEAKYGKGVLEVCGDICQFVYKKKRPTFSRYKTK